MPDFEAKLQYAIERQKAHDSMLDELYQHVKVVNGRRCRNGGIFEVDEPYAGELELCVRRPAGAAWRGSDDLTIGCVNGRYIVRGNYSRDSHDLLTIQSTHLTTICRASLVA